MQLETGVQASRWHVLASVQMLDGMRTQAGSGAMVDNTDIKSRTIVNLSAKYNIDNAQHIYAVIDNVLNKNYIATRQHGAIQVGKPRTIQLGYRMSF